MLSTSRDDVVDRICARLANGERLKAICRDRGFPAETTLRRWRAAYVHLSDRISEAVVAGGTAREQRKPTAYDPFVFADICARLDAGEHLQAILETPGMPSRYRLWKWRAQHAHVDQALAARVLRPRGPPRKPIPPYDEKTAEAFLDRIARGERRRDLFKDPTALSHRTWYAWLKTNPELRAGMRGASRHAYRKREMATRKLTPALQTEICRRMWEDRLSLNQIGQQPDMPSNNTLVLWQRDMPQFRDAIATARQMLLELLMDDVLEIADTVTNATAARDRVRVGALKKRVASLEAHHPWRRR